VTFRAIVRGVVKRGRLDGQRAVHFPERGADGMKTDEPRGIGPSLPTAIDTMMK